MSKFYVISRVLRSTVYCSATQYGHSVLGVFHNRNPSNLDSSDQRIRLFCDLNLNLDYEWQQHVGKNLTFGKFLLYCNMIVLFYYILAYIILALPVFDAHTHFN